MRRRKNINGSGGEEDVTFSDGPLELNKTLWSPCLWGGGEIMLSDGNPR